MNSEKMMSAFYEFKGSMEASNKAILNSLTDLKIQFDSMEKEQKTQRDFIVQVKNNMRWVNRLAVLVGTVFTALYGLLIKIGDWRWGP